MKNSSLEELIKDNIQKDFDCEFINRKVVLNKPNPIISRGNSDGEL